MLMYVLCIRFGLDYLSFVDTHKHTHMLVYIIHKQTGMHTHEHIHMNTYTHNQTHTHTHNSNDLVGSVIYMDVLPLIYSF